MLIILIVAIIISLFTLGILKTAGLVLIGYIILLLIGARAAGSNY